jgi:hypothetical protein
MVTVTLPRELESVVTEQALQQGTTPELLVLEELRQRFAPGLHVPPEEGSLADFLGEFVGCIHSGEVVPGGAQMAADSSKKFAAGMVKKRRDGKL